MIEFTRINNDVNGNPRYVCHYSNFLTQSEKEQRYQEGLNVWQTSHSVSMWYLLAVNRSHKIGGRKYHTKRYGSGIVFQSYIIRETEQDILRIVAEAEQAQKEN